MGDRIFETRQDIISIYYKGGVDFPNYSSLKMSGPWVGTFDVSEPDVFSLHIRTYTYKWGDRIFQTRQDIITICLKGA